MASSGASTSSKQKSKAYLSSVAIQSDAIKYRQKYKELKRKVREIEQTLTLRIKGNIQRLRLERAILYERLESQVQQVPIAESERRVDDASNISNEDSTESALNASLNDSHHKEPDTKSHLNDEDAQAAVTADIEETL